MNLPLPVEQQDRRGVVDGIAAASVRHLLREDPELLFHLLDLRGRAGQAGHRAVEQLGIFADLGGAVALRIDGDEQDLEGAVARAELLTKA